MGLFRIALANLRFPQTPEESVALAEQAIAQASMERARIVCFPECFVPGYRAGGQKRSSARRCVSRTGLVFDRGCRGEGEHRGYSGHGADHR